MMRETSIEMSGKSEEDAISKALAQIGLDRDEVSVEIVKRAKAGLLGIGATPAVVKVTYMTDTPEPVVEETPVEPPKSVPAAAPAKAAKPSQATGDTAVQAEQFLIGLLEKMDVAATPVCREEDGTLYIELVGNSMGSVIGRRGETLDAIQHLTNYAVNRGASSSQRTRIYLDAENYRKKREETLVRLANKVADKVVRYRKNMGLEPMNAYERHVIHTALQDVEHVTTYSSGTDPNRRVFVAYDRIKKGDSPPRQKTEREAPAQDVSPQVEEAAPDTQKTYREWS
ncbi:MAG: protein jag [Oscillospiraceae bacterium]|nr:protein jag [Oscillospiraceae bacterium]